MMSFISRSPRTFDFKSEVWHESSSCPGVRFATRQMSLLGRIELNRSIQGLVQRNEFLRAGDALEQTEAAIADLLARKAYLEWGISQIDGLMIDGRSADVELAIARGPERLCEEMVAAIRRELELSEDERKNS